MDNDQLNVKTSNGGEDSVFEALIRWIKESEERTECLFELLKLVRLPLLPPKYLIDIVQNEPLIKQDMNCRDLVDEAKDYHLMPDRRPFLKSFRTRPRTCPEVSTFLLDILLNLNSLTLYVFVSLYHNTITKVYGRIFVVGGITLAGDSEAATEYYDPTLKKWKLAESMETVRSRVGVAVLDDVLYAIGGYNGHERLATVETYNMKTKKWSPAPSMKCRRSALGVSVLENKLYVCGGYDGVSSLNSVECYDPIKKKWTEICSMKKHRSASGIATFDNHIVVLGGHDGLSIFDSVECYSPTQSKWDEAPKMSTKRCRLGVAVLLGKLYAAGGYDGNGFLKVN